MTFQIKINTQVINVTLDDDYVGVTHVEITGDDIRVYLDDDYASVTKVEIDSVESDREEKTPATAAQIIALLNRGVFALNAKQSDGKRRELEYILSRITAHRQNIRSIESCGD